MAELRSEHLGAPQPPGGRPTATEAIASTARGLRPVGAPALH